MRSEPDCTGRCRHGIRAGRARWAAIRLSSTAPGWLGSEERRVGKEGRSRGAADHLKKKNKRAAIAVAGEVIHDGLDARGPRVGRAALGLGAGSSTTAGVTRAFRCARAVQRYSAERRMA